MASSDLAPISTPKNAALQWLRAHVNDDIWEDGLGFFREGSVKEFRDFGELITTKIEVGRDKPFEVRARIAASTRSIQWIECTCKANRSTGQLCEHIAAFVFFSLRRTLCNSKEIRPFPPASAANKQISAKDCRKRQLAKRTTQSTE